MSRLDVTSWEMPPLPFIIAAVTALAALALVANLAITFVTPQYPGAEVEFDFEYVDDGTEVTVTLTENENAKDVVVRADADENWDNGAGTNSVYDDWERGASLSETGDSSTNLVTRGRANVTVVAKMGLLGRNEVLIQRKTYRAP